MSLSSLSFPDHSVPSPLETLLQFLKYGLQYDQSWRFFLWTLGFLAITAVIGWRDGTQRIIDHTLLGLLFVLGWISWIGGSRSWIDLVIYHGIPSVLMLGLGYVGFRRGMAGGGDGKYIAILTFCVGIVPMGWLLLLCTLLCLGWIMILYLCGFCPPDLLPLFLRIHRSVFLDNPRRYAIPLGVPLGISVWSLLFLIWTVDNFL